MDLYSTKRDRMDLRLVVLRNTDCFWDVLRFVVENVTSCLSSLGGGTLLGQKHVVDVGQDTTLSDGHT
jgi:hypothetical protein